MQLQHDFTNFSTSLPIRGPKTFTITRLFITVSPGCPSWANSISLSLKAVGMTIRDPRIKMLPSVDSANRKEKYGFDVAVDYELDSVSSIAFLSSL